MRRWYETALRMFKIMMSLSRTRSDLVYDLLVQEDLWSVDSTYLNLGFWPGADNIDDASRQLATLVASRANVREYHLVLDAGCGFGDQCSLWADLYPHTRFCAISNSLPQLKHAMQLVRQRKLDGRVSLVHCDATASPFPANTFDRILALESAFHFDTRHDFFRHAWQLLKPGGRIVLADFIARPSVDFVHRMARELGGAAWQIPRANLCSREQYEAGLQSCGFTKIDIQNVTEQVIEPFAKFIRDRYRQPEYRRDAQPLVRVAARIMTGAGFLESLDYVIASADKPIRA